MGDGPDDGDRRLEGEQGDGDGDGEQGDAWVGWCGFFIFDF